ncbi:conserved unknown protein [Ectocarpus siliculosus]|uniref:Trichome birefringence-like N-terminal domain-containing protein n=1 Tax=Ectocarpus siliculosus TaxID=2880 RepID=D8LHR2_ECTSI|nr:conserved unknown protein [Ectocarpus siliculosus]|eukprot:CBN79344.1 conserved unknown protein [Ectocarpus siliculosus]
MAEEGQGGLELRHAAEGHPDQREAEQSFATSSTGASTALRERLLGCRRLLWLAGVVGVLLIGMDALLKGRCPGGDGKDPPPLVVVGEERYPALVVDCANVETDLGLPPCYSSTSADPSQGRWNECAGGMDASPTNTGSGPFITGRTAKGCGKRWSAEHEGEEPVPPMPYWKWEPSACRLEEVDEAKFCRVMKGRKGLLFAGDSLTGEMIDTLRAVLRATRVKHVHLKMDTYTACDGELTLSWYRNDFLDTRLDGFDTPRCEEPDISISQCMVFADDATLSQYDTLLVNAGAHRQLGGVEAYGSMIKTAGESLTASMRRLHGDNAILVVRNTVPGHGESFDRMFTGPVNLDTALDLVEKGPPEFEWTTILDKNTLLEEAFEATHGWTLLDAYSPTILRADSHASATDGLHYCLPGPIDHWVVLLYNILLEKVKSDT